MSEEIVTRSEFEKLLKEIGELRAKLADVEHRLAVSDVPSQETLMVISAAVAAYLGKRATVRVVRSIGDSDQWRLQGRAALQASHIMVRSRALHR